MKEASSSHYDAGAYRAGAIPSLPASPKKRERIGEELLPFGDYAGVDPYQQLCEDAEFVQHQDRQDKAFYETDDWWWDHQRIRFLGSNSGVLASFAVIPYLVVLALGGLWLYIIISLPGFEGRVFLKGIYTLIVAILGYVGIFLVGPYLTRIVMSGVAWISSPIHGWIADKTDNYMEIRCSEFNRQTGMVSFAQGKKKPPLKAPFVEFDGYVERVVQRGGIFYRLMFVHRYTGKQFSQTSLSAIVDHKHEVHATWDMLQRYMDVSQPMPDVPRLEPFRHLDPTTAEHDRQSGRNPRYWRDLDLEAWKAGEGAAHLKAQIDYPWSRQRCQLTPQLGKVEMAVYREQREAAVA
ncbi:hypothetical protein HOP62_05300 [Halomonas sp. MCCC 1A17488]|uniref:hypothetical protein n=1 Tax=unclassified Halomonas TaxID=2609666 RepID=UPI0018D20FBB|nr:MULTISPECIES: hypothetical protein [unclassified Halomonas]MCE8015492.1 hypothetical protein [Halomonas sp. MCCC 1A17488]MCG3238825.1 hypothetical protein [Halomonas sp. MCCC 1A17488]QPP51213.1 hypothetical protein I4484_09100 [Halomonas sp. SS10-MC5]